MTETQNNYRHEVVGSVYEYDNGQAKVEFIWDAANRDGYAWSVKRQVRLMTYHRASDVTAALAASDNSDGAYGCARLNLTPPLD